MRANQARKLRLLLGGACCVAGAFFVWKLSDQSVSWWRARSWTPCDARIDDVSLRKYVGSDSTKYGIECAYRYTFSGQLYHGIRVGLASGPDGVGNEQLRRFEVLRDARLRGVAVRCFVDPDDPKQAVLFRDIRVGLLCVMLVLVVVFLGGGLMLIFVVREQPSWAGKIGHVRSRGEGNV